MVSAKFRVSEIFVPISKSRSVLNESRNLVFLCFFASRILEFLAARSRSLGFLFFWPTVSIKTMIKLFI